MNELGPVGLSRLASATRTYSGLKIWQGFWDADFWIPTAIFCYFLLNLAQKREMLTKKSFSRPKNQFWLSYFFCWTKKNRSSSLCKNLEDFKVEEKFGERNFLALSEMRGNSLYQLITTLKNKIFHPKLGWNILFFKVFNLKLLSKCRNWHDCQNLKFRFLKKWIPEKQKIATSTIG